MLRRATARALLLCLGTGWCTTGCSLVFPGDDYAGGAAEDGLQGDKLVARYFINEATSGAGSIALVDSSPTSLDLSIDYGDAHFGERDGNRGLFWDAVGDNGAASGMIGGTAVGDALTGARTATIELVVAVDAGPGVFLSVTDGMVLELIDSSIDLGWIGFGIGWDNFPVDGSRRVVHLRVDTAAEPRAAVLVDGVALPSGGSAMSLGDTLPLAASGSRLSVGNDYYGGMSLQGGILYLAIYGSALTDGEIDHNVALLKASDDGP